jgi:hypothetical protein
LEQRSVRTRSHSERCGGGHFPGGRLGKPNGGDDCHAPTPSSAACELYLLKAASVAGLLPVFEDAPVKSADWPAAIAFARPLTAVINAVLSAPVLAVEPGAEAAAVAVAAFVTASFRAVEKAEDVVSVTLVAGEAAADAKDAAETPSIRVWI